MSSAACGSSARRCTPRRRASTRELRVLAGETPPLKHWTPVHVHLGAEDVAGRIALLGARRDRARAAKLARRSCSTRHRRAAPATASSCATPRRATPSAAARVLDIFPPSRQKRSPERLALLAALADADPATRAATGRRSNSRPASTWPRYGAQPESRRGDAGRAVPPALRPEGRRRHRLCRRQLAGAGRAPAGRAGRRTPTRPRHDRRRTRTPAPPDPADAVPPSLRCVVRRTAGRWPHRPNPRLAAPSRTPRAAWLPPTATCG